jgi:hypothetical protein
MGWLGRGLGDFGSQVGQGFDINLGWKERLQNMAMEQARQKQSDLKNALDMQELQTRIKQMKSPQPAGIVKGPGGETSGVTFDPATGTYSLKNLIPGTPPEPKFPTLQAAAAYYLQKGDFDKLKLVNDEIDRNKTQKPPVEPKDAFELWRAQNPKASVADWLKLQEKYKKTGAEGGTKTPFELWMAQHPKGTYDQWANESKQTDSTDATKAVTAVLNAQKSLQSLEVGIQKSNKTFSIWNPNTWGTDPALTAIAQQATDDYNQKKQDAIEKLTDAGMPIPAWLSTAGGGGQQGNPPPPPVPGAVVRPVP